MKPLALLLAILLFLSPICALAQAAPADDFNDNQSALFEAVCWNMDFPKNAQIQEAIEYLCKTDGIQVHLLLARVSQNPDIFNMYGNQSELMLIDLESDTVITYANCTWPENAQITDKDILLNVLFSHWDSYTLGYNPFVYMDSEIVFPVSAEEIAAVNAALTERFVKPE